MSDRAQHPFVPALWQLIQAFWVGSLWGFHFVVLPVINKLGFASLLVELIRDAVLPALIGLTGCAVLLQLILLVKVTRWAELLQDGRGQLLLLALLAVLGFFVLPLVWVEPRAPQFFCYLLAAVAGLLLFFQPLPELAKQARVTGQA